MDKKYAQQIARTLHEIELADIRNGAKATRNNVTSNLHHGAPANAGELLSAAHAAASTNVCARCGKQISADANISLYVPLRICDLCAVQEATMELANSPLAFGLWHCCIGSKPLNPDKLWMCAGGNGADAKGYTKYPASKNFWVLKGSKINSHATDSCNWQALRAQLMDEGIIDSGYRFTMDYCFDSCSAAAGVVLGRSANGWVSWKDESGNLLDSLRH